SRVYVAAHSRATLPVFGGISGATRTTCSAGAGSPVSNRVRGTATAQEEAAWRGLLDERTQLVVRRPQEARPLAAPFDGAIEHVAGADGEGVWFEPLRRAVVEVDRQRLVTIGVHGNDGIRRIFDLHIRMVPFIDPDLVSAGRFAAQIVAEEAGQ